MGVNAIHMSVILHFYLSLSLASWKCETHSHGCECYSHECDSALLSVTQSCQLEIHTNVNTIHIGVNAIHMSVILHFYLSLSLASWKFTLM